MFAVWFILGTLVGATVMFLWVRFAIRFERAKNGIGDRH